MWIDCEMTGLELGVDELCEVAVVITDFDLNIVDPGIDIIIRPSDRALDNMGEYVTNMHKASGLLELLDQGVSVAEAQDRVVEYIKSFVPQAKKAPLAGNSVATDKAFLEIQMPAVIDHLHYRIVDVSSVKELARRWFPRTYFSSPDKNGGHRALADILESIRELSYYRAILFPEGEGPTSEECKATAQAVTESFAVHLGQDVSEEN